MKIDIVRQIGATNRRVAARDHEGRPARVVIATRTYGTAIEDLWDAITSPRRIPRWFLPVSGELRLGGRYKLEGNASGEITRCEPPRLLDLTWEAGGQVSWVKVRLSSQSGGTRLEVEHLAFVADDLWEQYGPGAVGVGWDMMLVGLDRHLSTGASIDPKEAAEWPTSDDGRAFVRGSSEEWARASIAAGTLEAAANAAAGRTTALYTGEPPVENKA